VTIVDAHLGQPTISSASTFGDVSSSTDGCAIRAIGASSSDSNQASCSVGLSCNGGNGDVSTSMLDSVGSGPIPSPQDGVGTSSDWASIHVGGGNRAVHGARHVVSIGDPFIETLSAVNERSLANSSREELIDGEIIDLTRLDWSWTHVELDISGLFVGDGMITRVPDNLEGGSWFHVSHDGKTSLSSSSLGVITGQIGDSSGSRLANGLDNTGFSVIQVVFDGGTQFLGLISNTSSAFGDHSGDWVEVSVYASHVSMRKNSSEERE